MDANTEVNQVTLYGFEMREQDKRRTRSGQYDVKQLWQRSHEIIGLALQGMKQSEIAKILGITQATVSNTLNSQLGKEKLSSMRENRDKEFTDLSVKVRQLIEEGMEVYHETMVNRGLDPEIRLRAADTVCMDIGGMRAPVKTETKNLTAHATLEEIEEFKRRGIAAAKESGQLIDIPEEIPDS